MGLLAAYWDLTWDLPKKLCTMHQKIEVTHLSWMATQRLPWLDHPRLPYAFSIT